MFISACRDQVPFFDGASDHLPALLRRQVSLLLHFVYALRQRLILDNLLDLGRIIVRAEVMDPCRLVVIFAGRIESSKV
mgnify:CR=1 FL=1